MTIDFPLNQGSPVVLPLGVGLNMIPTNGQIIVDFTSPMGTASGLYFSLVFTLPKMEYQVIKVDENFNVSPLHAQYYEITMRQKQQLEERIKGGLASAAQSVADYELMLHDARKLEEVLDYFTNKDEHTLRAMFLDQVDVHTGDGISMRSIAVRWPTIISDFMTLAEDDLDPKKITKKINVTMAEAVILTTKNKLYNEWKKTFGQTAKERYRRIKPLLNSRKKTIEEFREWLKPYIARHRMLKDGLSDSGGRLGTNFSSVMVQGQAISGNNVTLWAWKPLRLVEKYSLPRERKGDRFAFDVDPWDDPYMKEFKEKHVYRLFIERFPWLTKEKIDKKAAELRDSILKKYNDAFSQPVLFGACKYLDPNEHYYTFLEITAERTVIRVGGGELEDLFMTIKPYVVSQNMLFVRMLEYEFMQEEFESNLDEIIGMKSGGRTIEETLKQEYPDIYKSDDDNKKDGKKENASFKDVRKNFRKISDAIAYVDSKISGVLSASGRLFSGFEADVMVVKKGNYETDFRHTITKYYLAVTAAECGKVFNFLKKEMGVDV